MRIIVYMKSCRDIEISIKELKALADYRRLMVPSLLAYSSMELCVCELVAALGESQYNVSRALSELSNAGIVKKKKYGHWPMYSLSQKDTPLYNYMLRLSSPRPCCRIIARDIDRLKKRLSLRKNGICIVV